jgi:transcriptional regulator with GAF, ATPase, and Fis domain
MASKRRAPPTTTQDAASSRASPVLLAGRYRYDGELGRGASARVLGLLDATGERLVAKVLDASTGARAQWELDALLGVSDPHLVRVVELLRPDSALPPPFSIPRHAWVLIESRAPGERSTEVLAAIDEPPRRGDRLATVAVGVARALAALHDRGLSHGDVKPDNVLVEGEHATLVDLGAAAAFGRGETVSGTLAYMAPEAREGERSAATDLYALGATLAAWATGTPPEPGEAPTLPAWVPEHVAELARDLVAARIADRPRDADEVLTRLGRPRTAGARGSIGRAPLVGAEDAVARLVALLDQHASVAVVGPRGSGRSRLAEEAAREVQRREARAGRAAPTYWRGPELPWELRESAIVHLVGGQPGPRELDRFLARARIVGARHRVIVEADHEPPDSVVVRALPLSDAELTELLRALTGEPPSPTALAAAREATRGLPGRVVRAVESLGRGGRDPLQASDWREAGWMGRDELPLPRGARAALELAAAVGGQLQLAGTWRDDELREGARWALRAGLATRSAEGTLVVPDDVLPTLSPETRLRLARRAIELGASGPSRAIADAVLGHAAEGARAALGMAEEARTRGDPERARALLARHVRHAPAEGRVARELALALADALRAEGSLVEAATVLDAARSRTATDAAGEVPVELTLALAEVLRLHGRGAEALAALSPVLALPDEHVRADARALAARIHLAAGQRQEALALARAVGTASAAARARAHEVLAIAALGAARAREALTETRDGARAAQEIVSPHQRAAALARLGSLEAQALAADGRLREAREQHSASARLAHAAGERLLEASLGVNAGLASLDAGELGEGLAALERGAGLLARLGRTKELARATANFASALVLAGDDARARSLLDEAARACRDAADADAEALVAIVRAELAVHQGKLRSASVALEAALGAPSLAPIVHARLATLRALGGDPTGAEAVLARAPTTAEPRADAELALAEARVALARADLARATRALERARRHADEDEVGFELRVRTAATEVELAESIGERARARAALGRLREILEPTLRALPPALHSRFRQVPAHRRALAEGGVSASRPPDARARDAALDGVAVLAREVRLPALLERLAEVALDVCAAERAFVVEWRADGPRIRARAGAARSDPSARPSSALVARAIRESTVVSTDAVLEHDASSSVHALALRSVIAVRLAAGLGSHAPLILVADDRLRSDAFGPTIVEALRTVADVAGPLAAALAEARRARRGEREATRREESLAEEAQRQRETLRSLGAGDDPFADFVHVSPSSSRLVDEARHLAGSSLSLLLVGESGSGKDLLARAIHRASERRHEPFVAETGASLSGPLVESMLFGHARGAFTGADRARKGLFELAHRGTLFLDGVEDLSLEVQAKLLRALVERRIRPLGGDRAREVDVRVLAAMRRAPEEALAAGILREDLHYRLAGAILRVPPLRERPEDLDAIIERRLAREGLRARLSPAARAALHAHGWPGNVRELEHELARARLVASGPTIQVADLTIPTAGPALELAATAATDAATLHARRGELTRELVQAALASHGGNRTHAARALGISRFGLQKILRRLGEGRGQPK